MAFTTPLSKKTGRGKTEMREYILYQFLWKSIKIMESVVETFVTYPYELLTIYWLPTWCTTYYLFIKY